MALEKGKSLYKDCVMSGLSLLDPTEPGCSFPDVP